MFCCVQYFRVLHIASHTTCVAISFLFSSVHLWSPNNYYINGVSKFVGAAVIYSSLHTSPSPYDTLPVARLVSRTANLQSCILHIYSTNIGTEYFKHGVYSVFFFFSKCSLIIVTCFGSCIHILYRGVLKLNNFGAKRLIVKTPQHCGRNCARVRACGFVGLCGGASVPLTFATYIAQRVFVELHILRQTVLCIEY